MHEISVIVASDFDSMILVSALPGSVRVRARHGWWVVPLGPGVARDLLGDELIIPDLEDPNQAAELPRVLAPLTETLCRLPLQGAIALTFTQYFGGTGAQAAAVVKEHSVVFGPGLANVDFSALKNFAIYRESVLQFRSEFFNLFNHPNFNLPANRVTQPTYGRITTAMDPRIVQFELKYRF